MPGFFESQPVGLSQVFGEAAGKLAVTHDYLHPSQQRTGQHVAPRIKQHQALAPLHQLARVEAHSGSDSGGRVLDAMRVDSYARGLNFFGAFSQQAALK
jgi:hypothetical protein